MTRRREESKSVNDPLNGQIPAADNCFVESFNGSFRDECLNVHWFETMDEAKAKIEAWRVEYNESRPHEALKDLAPSEYALKCRAIDTTEVIQQAEK